jgi:cytochrome c556
MKKVLIAAALAACVSGTAFAGADDDIKYRQNSMKAIGSQMGSIVAILKGEVDNKAALAEHAALIGAATSTAITIPAFKNNTDGQGERETTAIGAVWTDWAKFEQGLKDLEAAGAAAAAAGADISFDNVKALGATCKSCHTAFREKK